MFAARANQENAIYEQQQAAAAKSLNQGAKALPPKTPVNKGAKTPFRVPLNDENAAFGRNKTGGKGKDGLFGEGKSTKLENNAFVTPADPRNRAPLGNKTTNAKATAFQTPAALTQDKQSAKHTSPRLRRAKIKVHDAEPSAAESEDDMPEIEHMPSREIPLPDHPEDWPHDRAYPQFEGANLTRGWWSEFSQQKDDDDDTEFSDFEEKLKIAEKREMKAQKPQLQAKKSTPAKASALRKTSTDPLSAKQPLTISSKTAATALSNQKKTSQVPSFAAPTAATKSRVPSAPLGKKSTTNAQPMPGNPRHGAARVASNSTLGYSKGRAVSASSRPLPAMQVPFTFEKKDSPVKTSLDDLFDMTRALDIIGDGNKNADGSLGKEDDDRLEDFQLGSVE